MQATACSCEVPACGRHRARTALPPACERLTQHAHAQATTRRRSRRRRGCPPSRCPWASTRGACRPASASWRGPLMRGPCCAWPTPTSSARGIARARSPRTLPRLPARMRPCATLSHPCRLKPVLCWRQLLILARHQPAPARQGPATPSAGLHRAGRAAAPLDACEPVRGRTEQGRAQARSGPVAQPTECCRCCCRPPALFPECGGGALPPWNELAPSPVTSALFTPNVTAVSGR